MSEVEWDGTNRRTGSPFVVQQQEPRIFRWVEAMGPAVAVLIGGAMAYGGIQARMEAQAESIAKLEQVPVQIANIRTEIQSSTAGIRVEQAQRLADITQRMATVEQRSQRNYENNTAQWEVIRDNQGKVSSLIRSGN